MKKVFGIWTTLPRARPYVRPYRKLAGIAVLFTFLAAGVALAEPWPLAILVDSVLGEREPPGIFRSIFGGNPGQYEFLVFVVLIGLTITLFTHGITVLAEWVSAKLEQRMVLDLRSDLFNHCERLSLTFHDGRMTGQLMQQINNQAAAMGAIIVAFPPILQAVLTLIGMFIVTTLISWKIALISLVAVPFIWYSLGLYGTRIVPRLQRVQALEWQSLSIVHEAMAMLRVIVAFGREDHEYQRFRKQGETAVEERVKLTVRQTLFSLGVTAATAMGTSLVLGFGAWSVIQGDITVGQLLVLIAYVASIYQPLEQISNTIGDLNEHFVQFNSSLDLLDIEREVTEADDAIALGRSNGRVEFESVSFAYGGREDTLIEISFVAQPGQRVAIVGPTGAGKTTLANLLIRYYDPAKGRILIDGVDLRQLKLDSLREQITVVLQEPLLFSGTIAENIRYGKLDATMDEIVVAAQAANVHDFIERQPHGYDTVLGERGAQLSGGERQRIAVARAFIKDASILVLDEPTSSIDSRTEGVILDALEDLMEGRTSFMIAHRLSTIRDADLILVVQDGRIVEQGSHEALVRAGGVYRELHEAQTRLRRRRRPAQAPWAAGIAAGVQTNGQGATQFAKSEAGDFDRPTGAAASAERVQRAADPGDFDARQPDSGPPPEEIIRRYLESVGGEAEVPLHNLLTSWRIQDPAGVEGRTMAEALNRAGVALTPALTDLGKDDLVRLNLAELSQGPAESMHGGPRPLGLPPAPGAGRRGLVSAARVFAPRISQATKRIRNRMRS
jgi:ABC-type multidrug transport system fused ATPase/permease subunit